MSQENNLLRNKIECLIFVAGKPLNFKKIAEILGIDSLKIKEEILKLREEYFTAKRGLVLVMTSETVEMVTNPLYSKEAAKITTFELEEKLSAAALETLAIIAYRGPITRAEIEIIRGVNCVYTLRNLAVRGLILRKQNPKGQRLAIYEISERFLKHCGLTHETNLPNFAELSKKTSFEEYLKNKESEAIAKIEKTVSAA